ncbi:hypothetical protein EVAR_51605_1 [Eumeta japonica]|uniref:Uncharacterized protein n=1 Tax=Eumeta variegata TaxID=151549 RepID=A0A4C1YFW7_EUMVA|nr:hypothetical protein EVAR_51605_1 [Eumeta japonica]
MYVSDLIYVTVKNRGCRAEDGPMTLHLRLRARTPARSFHKKFDLRHVNKDKRDHSVAGGAELRASAFEPENPGSSGQDAIPAYRTLPPNAGYILFTDRLHRNVYHLFSADTIDLNMISLASLTLIIFSCELAGSP